MSSSSFKTIETVLKVSLLPCHTEYPLLAVKEQINELLFRFHENLSGVPVSYHDLKLPMTKEYGRIMNELPWVHIDISVKLLVFQPQPNDIISGQINKISDSHIALLVYGMFNASILETELSPNYTYSTESTNWSCNDGKSYSEGDVMEFRVIHCHHSHGVFYIEGGPVVK